MMKNLLIKLLKVTKLNLKSRETKFYTYSNNTMRIFFHITGVVCQVTNEGVLLQLFNDVCGWVPKSKISVETIEHPEKLFFLGQVLKSKVLDVTPHKKRMSLTLILTEEKLAPLGSKQKKISEKIQKGVVYENIKVI